MTQGPPEEGQGASRLPVVVPGVVEEAWEAVPGLSRLALSAALRTAAWSAGSAVRTSRLVARSAVHPPSALDLVDGVAREVAVAAGAVADLARSVGGGTPFSTALLRALEPHRERDRARVVREQVAEVDDDDRQGTDVDLRRRGEELLARSRDVWLDERAHPAYERILDELAPDEARVLVLLAQHGPQPSVDVRTGGPVGMVSSQLVAPGLTMIGARAGCRHPDRVPSYLNNLHRLGLVWFSREQVSDPGEYQVLEAQPDVLDAIRSVRFAKTVRRSIHLTPFGVDFCARALVDEDPGTLPGHATPSEGDQQPEPES